ncbi:flavoprotein, partial [Francisella tularensis]|uniref:flavoprotein n=1 Tax=Francisella tularensis TaxID=263 RepID=UPI0023819D6A
DLLSQTILANDDNSKVYIAPAMNVHMWQNQLTQDNINKLQTLGFKLILPDKGLQACGDSGSGRLHEPEVLFDLLSVSQDFKAIKVVITVGATVVDIDGVR